MLKIPVVHEAAPLRFLRPNTCPTHSLLFSTRRAISASGMPSARQRSIFLLSAGLQFGLTIMPRIVGQISDKCQLTIVKSRTRVPIFKVQMRSQPNMQKPTFTNPATGISVIGRNGIKRHMLATGKTYLFWVRDDGAQYHASIKNSRLRIDPILPE